MKYGEQGEVLEAPGPAPHGAGGLKSDAGNRNTVDL